DRQGDADLCPAGGRRRFTPRTAHGRWRRKLRRGPTYTISPLQGLKDVLAAQGNATANVTLITVKDDNSDLDAARAAAAAADAVIIMAGTIAEEGADRASFTDAAALTVTQVGDNLDWYVARPNTTSTAT